MLLHYNEITLATDKDSHLGSLIRIKYVVRPRDLSKQRVYIGLRVYR